MKGMLVCFLLFCAAAQIQAVSVSAPNNGISHPRREQRQELPDSRRDVCDWEPNDTRRPRAGQSGWQYTPGNKWKAPRDAKAQKRRDYDRSRRRNTPVPGF